MTIVHDTIAAEIATLPVETRVARIAAGYGVDMLCVDDIDARASDTVLDSDDSLRQDCYHRLTTTHGSVPGDDPGERDFGIDVRSFLHRGMTQRELVGMSGAVTSELKKDDRVAEAACDVTFAAGTLTIACHITPEDPAAVEFDLILTVSDAAVKLLES